SHDDAAQPADGVRRGRRPVPRAGRGAPVAAAGTDAGGRTGRAGLAPTGEPPLRHWILAARRRLRCALPALRQAALVVGRGEEPLAVDAWTDDVGAYTPLALDRLAGPDDNLAAELAAICAERGLTGGAMGYEGSFDLLGVPHWQGEVRIPSEASLAALRRMPPGDDFRDATSVLRAARTVKSA